MTIAALHATALGNVSDSLQALHRVLVWFQAKQMGINGSPLQLFDHATNDRAFAWLKPLREAIVALDDRRAEPEPISDVEREAFIRQFRGLLGMNTSPLAAKLKATFQSDPEAIWATSNARKVLDQVS